MENIIYQFKLGRLFRKLDKSNRFYDNCVAESAKKKEGNDALHAIIAERAHEDDLIQIDIDLLTTRHLLKRARRLMISVPELSDEGKYWKKDHEWFSSYSLSRNGIKYL